MVGYLYYKQARTIEAALIKRFLCPKKEGPCFSTGPLRIIVTQNSLLLSHKENRQQPVFFRRKQIQMLTRHIAPRL